MDFSRLFFESIKFNTHTEENFMYMKYNQIIELGLGSEGLISIAIVVNFVGC